jgi:hypothetical protein
MFPCRKGNHFETLVESSVFFPRMLVSIGLSTTLDHGNRQDPGVNSG